MLLYNNSACNYCYNIHPCGTYFDMHIILQPYNIPGQPTLVQPLDTTIDLHRLKEDIPKYRQWLKEENVIWWDHFDVESVYRDVIDCGEWAISEFKAGI